MWDSPGRCQGPWLMMAQWWRWRHKTKGRSVDELPAGGPVMDFTTAAECSWNAAFSQPFFPLIRLLPDSLCRHHWRLYLSFVFHGPAVAGRFILALPVASSQFSVPFRRLRHWMTPVIVLMEARICSLPLLCHLRRLRSTCLRTSAGVRGEKVNRSSAVLNVLTREAIPSVYLPQVQMWVKSQHILGSTASLCFQPPFRTFPGFFHAAL